MDDPTRRCEKDTGNGMRLSGLPFPSGGPLFFSIAFYLGLRAAPLPQFLLPYSVELGLVDLPRHGNPRMP